MSLSIFCIGPSGSGKTTAIRTLDPKKTFIFNALKKDLPWRGSAKQYTYWDKDKNPTGNMVATSHANVILQWLSFINEKMPHIESVVIDDNTFVTALELQRRAKENSWDRFNDIAQNFIEIAAKSKSMRDNLTVFLLHHTMQEGDDVLQDKTFRAMSYGKLLDTNLGSQEAQFTIVLRSAKEKDGDDINYVFYTKCGQSTVKTPDGMFSAAKIPNDLEAVRVAAQCYYNDDCADEPKVEAKKVKEKV